MIRWPTNPAKAWPYDESYACTCSQCGEAYEGPKRSPSCWECASEARKQWWLSLHPTPPAAPTNEGER